MLPPYRHEAVDVHFEAVRALANLSTSSKIGQRAIIDADALPEIDRLLLSSHPGVVRYASTTRNNILR
jgi:hypothetical protein